MDHAVRSRALFSPMDDRYAFGEMDEVGKSSLAAFAAESDHRSAFDLMPVEGRVYFTRKAPCPCLCSSGQMEELSFKIARMRGLRDEVTADSQSGVPEALFVYSYCLHRHAGRRTVRSHRA